MAARSAAIFFFVRSSFVAMSVEVRKLFCRVLAFALVVLVWLFPFTPGPSANWLPQIVAVVALALAATCLGFGPLPRWHSGLVAVGGLLLVLMHGTYVSDVLFGVTALILLWTSAHVGSRARINSGSKKALLFGVGCAAVISAIQGLLQFLGLVGGLWPWVIDPLQRGLAYGALRQPNLFATLLVCGVIALIWLYSCRTVTIKMTWLLITLVHIGSAASASRVGFVEVLVIAGMAVVWRNRIERGVWRLLVGQALIYAACQVLVVVFANLHDIETPRVLSDRLIHPAQGGRLILWSNMLDLIAARPWLGWGWRELGYAHYVTHFPIRFGELLDNAHNLPLHLAVEFGLPVTLSACGLLLWWVWRAKPWLERQADRQFAWLLLLVIGAHSLVELPLWNAGFIFIAGMASGLVCSSPSNLIVVPSKFSRLIPYAACCALIVLSALAWNQYQKVIAVYEISSRFHPERKSAAIELAEDAWLFRGQVEFAKLGTMVVRAESAPNVRAMAEKLLHFSAEPRVIEPLLKSLWLLQDREPLRRHVRRYCEAFPKQYAVWERSVEGQAIINALGERCAS